MMRAGGGGWGGEWKEKVEVVKNIHFLDGKIVFELVVFPKRSKNNW